MPITRFLLVSNESNKSRIIQGYLRVRVSSYGILCKVNIPYIKDINDSKAGAELFEAQFKLYLVS